MRFAIITESEGGQEKVVLTFSPAQVKALLLDQVNTTLADSQTWMKKSWSREEVSAAVADSWEKAVLVFKTKTHTLP